LDWTIIEKMCSENQVDAIFSLEMFDTDAKLDVKVNQITVSTPLGNVPGVETEANL
jgi:hypothetical protein